MDNYEVIITQTAGAVSCNFEAAKAYLDSQLAYYKGLVFTEENKKSAKETVARLRKQKKELADRVLAVKKEYMAPFETFADQAKELMDKYDEPINFINGQVADFERKRIAEKQEAIRMLYEQYIEEAELKEILPLSRIYNPKWENATTSQKAIIEEMMERKEAAKQAVRTIKDMHSDVEEAALNMYKESYDLSGCILYINSHEKQKAEILKREQERIRREEEERIRREEREKLEAERRAEEALAQERQRAEQEKQQAVAQAREEAAQEAIDGLIPEEEAEAERTPYQYTILLTDKEKEALELYMTSVGIDFKLMW